MSWISKVDTYTSRKKNFFKVAGKETHISIIREDNESKEKDRETEVVT